jgi:hypothetical protein
MRSVVARSSAVVTTLETRCSSELRPFHDIAGMPSVCQQKIASYSVTLYLASGAGKAMIFTEMEYPDDYRDFHAEPDEFIRSNASKVERGLLRLFHV